jgi:hypothetical protein
MSLSPEILMVSHKNLDKNRVFSQIPHLEISDGSEVKDATFKSMLRLTETTQDSGKGRI